METPPDIPEQEIYREQHLLTLFLLFDPCLSPLRDSRVRKALCHAINRQTIFERFRTSGAHGGLVPPGMPGHSPDIGLPYDVDLAHGLIAEAGFPGGVGFPSLTVVTFHTLVPRLGNELSRQWREQLGIEVNFVGASSAEIGDWKEKRISGEMLINGWAADYPDPDNFLRQSEAIAVLNTLGWRDAEYDRLVEQAASTSDRGKRLALYRRADHILVNEQALIMPITYGFGAINFLVKPWVKNYKRSLVDILPYQEMRIENR
jgi:ABC-type transport system substrate-binding protein